MNIGNAIRSIRKKLSVSQSELAQKCNLSQTSVSQIETGAKRPSQRTIAKICVALDIPESVIYIVAMQGTDSSEGKDDAYSLVYPSLRSLALQMLSPEHIRLTGND
jgi:transcriptional regulator with XRE-family HTH domain